MTRVIAGELGGRTLRAPSGSGTRPTSDRVREALFSALASRQALADARVLDLYAGSGALGIEALSRGAAAATFVESDRRAVAAVRANLSALALAPDRARVVGTAVATFLTGPGHAAYDLVLLDPPYPLAEDDLAAVLALLPAVLAEDGLVVVERSSRSPEPTWPPGLVADGHRTYGETAVWYAVAAGEE